MPRKKLRYQMYQPHNVKPISTENNKYLIYYEETSWSLDEGPGEWRRIDEPLEVQSDDIDEYINQLNIKTVENIVEDYKTTYAKILIAHSANPAASELLKTRRNWCYLKWKEFDTMFDIAGWQMDVELPVIFNFRPSPDYTTIYFGNEVVHITETQGKVIKILHINYLNGIYFLTTDEIFTQLIELGHKTDARKMSVIFDNKDKESNILINIIGRGKYSLNMPPI